MRYFPDLMGNSAVKERLGQLIVAGKLPHALILEGEEGMGKRYFARRIAAALLCEHRTDENRSLPGMGCAACRKVMEGKAMDVHYLTREDKASIGVDPIRAIRRDIYLSSTESEKKIYIIEEAHAMTVQAQNALLIVLEEPPEHVHIILTAESREALLTTIRSRAQLVRMGRLTREELAAFGETQSGIKELKRTKPDAYEEALLASQGRAGTLLHLTERGEMSAMTSQRETVFRLINALAERQGLAVVLDGVKAMSSKRKELSEDLSALQLAIRDLCLLAKDENAPLLFYTNREYALLHSSALGSRRLHHLYDVILDTQNSLQRNANMSLLQTTLATSLVAG